MYSSRFCRLFGVPGLPKAASGGRLRFQFQAKVGLWFPEGAKGGFGVPNWPILEVIWGCFGWRFWWVWWGLASGSCYSHEHVSACSATVFNHFDVLQELFLAITCQTHLQHHWCFLEDDACAWGFQNSKCSLECFNYSVCVPELSMGRTGALQHT